MAVKDGVTHHYHVFPFCTCGAGGMGTDHSDHCSLDSEYLGLVPATLVFDDALIVERDG